MLLRFLAARFNAAAPDGLHENLPPLPRDFLIFGVKSGVCAAPGMALLMSAEAIELLIIIYFLLLKLLVIE